MRKVTDRLTDILTAAGDIEAWVGGLTVAEAIERLSADGERYRAIKNAFIEIGEAIKHLPPDMKARNPSIDWKGFVGFRDVLTHRHFRREDRDRG